MSAAQEIRLPDIGDFEEVEIIDIPVSAGDRVAAEDTLLTLESDKASMDIPVPAAGVVRKVLVKVGDKVSRGTPLALIEPAQIAPAAAEGPEEGAAVAASAAVTANGGPAAVEGSGEGAAPASAPAPASAEPAPVEPAPPAPSAAPPPVGLGAPMSGAPRRDAAPAAPAPPAPPASPAPPGGEGERPHASPSVRRFAREVGVELGLISGTGRKNRITRDDVKAFVKSQLSAAAPPEAGRPPPVDFSKFGPVSTRPLSRIQRRSGRNLARNWAAIPHVTQFDEADITELEDFRALQREEAARRGIRLTLLPFLIKAAADALRRHPEFSASLGPDGGHVILKDYCHIGVAVNTDSGLVVPVIRDVDKKGLLAIAEELGALIEQARAGRLAPKSFQGGCFTVSSLGGVGGGHFTPIINAPELAILGISRAVTRPVWDGEEFAPRRILPFSLSYDHRVIDGVAGARFTRYLAAVLEDIRRVLL